LLIVLERNFHQGGRHERLTTIDANEFSHLLRTAAFESEHSGLTKGHDHAS
jgi:hypothetical protein